MYHMQIHSSLPTNQTFLSSTLLKQSLFITAKAHTTEVGNRIYKVLRRLNIWKLFWEGLIKKPQKKV